MEEIRAALANAPRYPRPPRDTSIALRAGNGSGELVDKETGDSFLIQTADRERQLLDFRFGTKDGKLVCIFRAKFGPGNYGRGDWPPFPVRVWGIVEAPNQTPDIIAARGRISVQRFAQYLTILPEFNGDTPTDYVVIDAPAQKGERL